MCLVKVTLLVLTLLQSSVIKQIQGNETTTTMVVDDENVKRLNRRQYFYYTNRSPDDWQTDRPCLNSSDCDEIFEFCNVEERICECKQYFYRVPSDSRCAPCPLEGQFCRTCCYGHGLECQNNRCVKCRFYDSVQGCVSTEEFYIVTAAQVTMIGAFALLIIALCGILYHRFTKNSFYTSRRRDLQRSNLSPGSRVSVSSLQRGVLSRLQDRPPKYETHHNYMYKIKSQTSVQPPADANTAAAGISQISGTVPPLQFGIAPPTYEPSDEQPQNENPPPYTPSAEGGTTTIQSAENTNLELIQKLYPEPTVQANISVRTDINI